MGLQGNGKRDMERNWEKNMRYNMGGGVRSIDITRKRYKVCWGIEIIWV